MQIPSGANRPQFASFITLASCSSLLGPVALALGALTMGALASGCSAPAESSGANSGVGGLPVTGTGAMVGTGATGGDLGVGGTGAVGTGGMIATGGTGGTGGTTPKEWPSAECVTQVDGLLAQMTLQQKAAQMLMTRTTDIGPGQLEAGQVTNVFAGGDDVGAVPMDFQNASPQGWATFSDGMFTKAASAPLGLPLLFGVDAVHGHNRALNTVIFPHNIGLGATRNEALIEEIGRITAIEMLATGVNWTFGPMMSVSFDDRWGRVYESYSEDPNDVAAFGTAAVRGLQGPEGLGGTGVVACAKHFAGDGMGTYGTSAKGGTVDRGDVQVDEATMRTYGIDPYRPAIEAGLGSIMASDTTWNGTNMTRHAQLLTDILKGELGFKGFIATDWNGAVIAGLLDAVNAGVDMFMEPEGRGPMWVSDIVAAVPMSVSEERVTDAARRILLVKCEAGAFGWSRDTNLLAQVGSAEHREVGRQAVRESLVLLQHQNSVLPMTKGTNVYVAGSGADSLQGQAGGWTVSWQGAQADLTEGTTVREAVSSVATVVDDVNAADVALIVLSEEPYAEFLGDVSSIDTLTDDDMQLVANAKAAGKPVVALIFSGRPVLLTTEDLAQADAWIAGWLPGTEGLGITDVLFGDHNFVGKLSHSWPRSNEQANQNKDDPGFDPLFPYGHGLTY